jgi:hypothetical protein
MASAVRTRPAGPSGLRTVRDDLGPWREEEGNDIAEYAVILAVLLVIVVGTIRLIGSNAENLLLTH